MDFKTNHFVLIITFIAFTVLTVALFYVNIQTQKHENITSVAEEILGTSNVSKLDITNSVSSMSENIDQTFNLTLSYTISNVGNTTILSPLVVNDLESTFNEHTFEISSISAHNLVINDKFDGKINKLLLSQDQSLQPKQSGTINLNIKLYPRYASKSFLNNVVSLGNGDQKSSTSFSISISERLLPNSDIAEDNPPTPMNSSSGSILVSDLLQKYSEINENNVAQILNINTERKDISNEADSQVLGITDQTSEESFNLYAYLSILIGVLFIVLVILFYLKDKHAKDLLKVTKQPTITSSDKAN